MSDLGWRADGISRAMAAGGVPLERYRRPGFTDTVGVRRSDTYGGGYGFDVRSDPDPDEYEDGSARRANGHPVRKHR